MSWVILRTFSGRMEAEIARGLLEEHGIRANIQADDVGGMRPHLGMSAGVRLLVEDKDALEAQEILESEIEI